MTNPTRALTVFLLSLAMVIPATATADQPEGQRNDTVLQLDDEDSAELHPTGRRHRHRRVRRRRVRRRRTQVVHPVAPRRARDDRVGIYLGLGGLGNFFIDGGEDITKMYRGGGGFALHLGGRFSRWVAAELAYSVAFQQTQRVSLQSAQINDGAIQTVTFDAKIFPLPSSTRLEPFVQVGAGAYLLSETFHRELTGVGLQLGGGVDIRFSRLIALGLRALYHGFYVDNADGTYGAAPTEAAFLNTVSAEANLQFHF